jgi:hypothetical protein
MVLDVIQRDRVHPNEVVMVISQFSLMLDLVEDLADLRGIPCDFFDGTGETETRLVLCRPHSRIDFTKLQHPDILVVLDGPFGWAIPKIAAAEVYSLSCEDCCESELSRVSFTPVRAEVDKLYRIAAIQSRLGFPVPSPEDLLEAEFNCRASPAEFLALLTVHDFLNFCSPPPDLVAGVPLSDWTVRARNQVLRGLLRFGWKSEEHFAASCGICQPSVDLKQAARAVLRFMNGDIHDALADKIIEELEPSPEDFDFISTGLFGETCFHDRMRKNAATMVERLALMQQLVEFNEAAVPGANPRDVNLANAARQFGIGVYERYANDDFQFETYADQIPELSARLHHFLATLPVRAP